MLHQNKAYLIKICVLNTNEKVIMYFLKEKMTAQLSAVATAGDASHALINACSEELRVSHLSSEDG